MLSPDCQHLALAILLAALLGCDSGSRRPPLPGASTVHPSNEAPELYPFFEGDGFHFVGEFFRNYVYLMKGEEGRFFSESQDGSCDVDVFIAREKPYVFFHDPSSGGYAAVDLSETDLRTMDPNALEFIDAPPDSIAIKAFERARDPSKFPNDKKEGKRAAWIYVDVQNDAERNLESFYVEKNVHSSADPHYEFLQVIGVTQERVHFVIDGKARESRSTRLNLMAEPIADPDTRPISDGDVADAIWRLFETRAIQ